MKILLTGEPKSGKTTILKAALASIETKQGFVTEEIPHDGERTGFELIPTQGHNVLLASTKSASEIRVSKYGVNIGAFEDFMDALPSVHPTNLLYIDEIGQMQLYSDEFKFFVQKYLDAPNLYLGTISCVFKDDFIDAVLHRQDVVLLHVDKANRASIQDVLSAFIDNFKILCSLNESMKHKVMSMAKSYGARGNYLQLKKLFKNAVRYTAEARITSISSGNYTVK